MLSRFEGAKRAPVVAIVLEVEEVFIHCASALNRGHAWRPDRWLSDDAAPSMKQLWDGHLARKVRA